MEQVSNLLVKEPKTDRYPRMTQICADGHLDPIRASSESVGMRANKIRNDKNTNLH